MCELAEEKSFLAEEAVVVVEDHIRWLDENNRKTIADAFRHLYFYMGFSVVMPDEKQSDYATYGHSFGGSVPYDEHIKLKSEIDKLKADLASANELLAHKGSCIDAMAWQCAKYHEAVALLRRFRAEITLYEYSVLHSETEALVAAIDAYEENLKKQT